MKKDKSKKNLSKNVDFFELTKIKDNKLDRNSRLKWTEETYINFSDKELNKSDRIFFGLSVKPKILKIFLFVVFICLGILLAR